MKKQILRSLVCLLLVCCMIVNVSPIRAEAIALEAGLAIGAAAVAILAAAGVVFNPKTAEDVTAIGNSLTTYLYQWGTSAEKLDEVEEFVTNLQLLNFDPDEDPDDDTPHRTQVKLAQGILVGIVAWITSVIAGFTQIEGSDEQAPEGFVYYNGYCFPSISAACFDEDCRYFALYQLDDLYYAYCSGSPFLYSSDANILLHPACVEFVYQTEQWVHTYTYSDGWQFNYDGQLLWSNYDILYDGSDIVFFSGSDSSDIAYMDLDFILVGDVAPGVADGTLSPDTIIIPNNIELGNIITSNDTLVDDLADAQQGLVDDPDSHDDYIILVTPSTSTDPDTGTETQPATEPVTDPDSGSDANPDVGSGTLAGTTPGTFIDSLIDALMTPFEWLVNALLEGIKAIFVPSADYLTAKVDALRAEFDFADSIIDTFEMFGPSLFSVDTSPPIIYIDLGASRGSYYLGEKVVFVDLTWYAEYKPTVDVLISAFLWVVFVWRVAMKLPGIISGVPGDFVMDGLNIIGMSDHLPTRKAAYEIQRQSNRQLIRKGPRQ